MTHSIESTVWHVAFIIQYGGLLAATVMVVTLLVTTLYELGMERMRDGRIPAPAVVHDSASGSVALNG
jgi:hypothetical protein